MKRSFHVNRWFLILILLGFVIFCAWYSVAHRSWMTLDQCRQNPIQYHNAELSMFQEPKILKLYADGFELGMKNQPPIRVYGDTARLKKNEYVELVVTFHKDGYLIVKKAQIAKNRRFKIWGSVIPVLIIFIFALRFFHFNWLRFEIEVKDHA